MNAIPLAHYTGRSVPLMYGSDSSIDVDAHGGLRPSVSLNLDGPISVHSSLTPANARALAAELVKAADAAEAPPLRAVNPVSQTTGD